MDLEFLIEARYGSSEVQSRLWPVEDGRIEGQSRRIERDSHGNVTEMTPWKSSGIYLG